MKFSCKHCVYTGDYDSVMVRHVKQKHLRHFSFFCGECGLGATDSGDVKLHIADCHGDKTVELLKATEDVIQKQAKTGYTLTSQASPKVGSLPQYLIICRLINIYRMIVIVMMYL